jgi:hypothetical protein
MAQRGAPVGWDSSADRPSILAITIESSPRRRARPSPAQVLIAVAVVGAIITAIVIAALPGGGSGSAPQPSPVRHTPPAPQPTVLVDSGPPSANAPDLYRFPVGCPASGITAIQRGRTGPCSPHGGYVTVVLRRVDGAWHSNLEPISRACAPIPMPPLARGKVRACRR